MAKVTYLGFQKEPDEGSQKAYEILTGLSASTVSRLKSEWAKDGVTGNSRSIQNFANEVKMLLYKWLGRRGKWGSLNYDKFNLLLLCFPLPTLRIMVNLC